MANVLVVDDHEDLLHVLSIYLKTKGFAVEAVQTDEGAKKTLSVFTPDVILLDVKLNGSDGRKLCKEIKERYNPNIPVILFSVSRQLLADYKECKADAVIEKPFNLETVIEKINEVINKYKNVIA